MIRNYVSHEVMARLVTSLVISCQISDLLHVHALLVYLRPSSTLSIVCWKCQPFIPGPIPPNFFDKSTSCHTEF